LLKKSVEATATYYHWPLCMADLDWVDYGAFRDAYERAIQIHDDQLSSAIDRTMLNASFQRDGMRRQGRTDGK
jgi:hypothetical protein